MAAPAADASSIVTVVVVVAVLGARVVVVATRDDASFGTFAMLLLAAGVLFIVAVAAAMAAAAVVGVTTRAGASVDAFAFVFAVLAAPLLAACSSSTFDGVSTLRAPPPRLLRLDFRERCKSGDRRPGGTGAGAGTGFSSNNKADMVLV